MRRRHTHYAYIGAQGTACGLEFAREVQRGRSVRYVLHDLVSLVSCEACLKRLYGLARRPERPAHAPTPDLLS